MMAVVLERIGVVVQESSLVTASGRGWETKGEDRKGSDGLQRLTKCSSSDDKDSRGCGRGRGRVDRGRCGAADQSASSRLVKAGNGGTSGNAGRWRRITVSGALSLTWAAGAGVCRGPCRTSTTHFNPDKASLEKVAIEFSNSPRPPKKRLRVSCLVVSAFLDRTGSNGRGMAGSGCRMSFKSGRIVQATGGLGSSVNLGRFVRWIRAGETIPSRERRRIENGSISG